MRRQKAEGLLLLCGRLGRSIKSQPYAYSYNISLLVRYTLTPPALLILTKVLTKAPAVAPVIKGGVRIVLSELKTNGTLAKMENRPLALIQIDPPQSPRPLSFSPTRGDE